MKNQTESISHHETGVTLVELIVVVAIIGILALASVAGLAKMRRRAPVENGARQVALEMQNARMRAIAQTGRFKVVFEKITGKYTGRYQIFQDVAGTWTSASDLGRLPNNVTFGGRLSNPQITFTHTTEPDEQPVYEPGGGLENTNGSPGQIFVTNTGGSAVYRVDVNQLTGGVSIVRVSG